VTTHIRRVVVPGSPVNKLATVREEVVREVARSPLPMRGGWTPPPPPTRRERILAVATPRRTVNVPRHREPARVTGEQLLRARQLKRLGQRDLAARLNCARSTVAAAEQGLRPILPNIEEWVEAVLREHGEWTEPEGGDHADDADEGPALRGRDDT